MSTFFPNLTSTGPNSVGPGTSLRVNETNPSRSVGRITAFESAGINTPAQLAALRYKMPAVFPGYNLPRAQVEAKMYDGGQALVVAYYGSLSTGANGFSQVLQRSPAGFRAATIYSYPNADKNLDPVTALPRPRVYNIPQETIRWNSRFASDIRPISNNVLAGTYNRNTYTIDGYRFNKETLRFDGEYTVHEKNGGIDRWYLQRQVTHDPLGFKEDTLEVTGIGAYTIGITKLPAALVRNWGNMP